MTEEIRNGSPRKVAFGAAIVALSILLATGAVLYAIVSNRDASTSNAASIEQLKRETHERRDIACKGAERQHAQEVTDLERSYEIFEDPPPSFREILQEPFAIQGLQEDIRDAQKDQDRYGVFVPSFCDDRGIGEKEPDPVMPVQPPEVQRLLRVARH